METARLIALEGENIKRMRAYSVKLPPSGGVVIAGENSHGKTSFLDSIQYLLGGTRKIHSKPIREGAESAQIVGVLDVSGGVHEGQLMVKRTFEANGKSVVEITSAEGYHAPTPQQILDSFVGAIAFDPLAFTRLKPAEQAKQLQEIVGLDVSDLKAEYEEAYESRTHVGRELRSLTAKVKSLPFHDDAPSDIVSVSELMSALQKVNRQNAENQSVRDRAANEAHRLATAQQAVQRALEDVQKAERRLADARKSLEASQATESQVATIARAAQQAADLRKDEDTSDIEDRIAAAETINARVRENAAKLAAEEELAAKQAEHDSYTARVKAAAKAKQDRLAAVQWPVDGLGFTEEGVTYNGIPFDQCATSEQLRVSVAIAAAANPKLRLMLVRDGSLLGEDRLRMLHDLAVEKDFQILIEYATRGPDDKVPCSILIEDGYAYDQSAE